MLTARSRALLAARVSLDSGTKACRFGRTEVIHFEVEEPAPSPCSRSSDHGREAFAFRQAQQKTKNDDVEKDEKETDEDETDSDDNATFFYQPPLRGEASRTAKLKTLRSDETVVTLGEFIAILQCSRPVGRPFRNSLELERSATSRVRKDFAPIRRGLRDLKQGIRSASSELEGQVASFPEAGCCSEHWRVRLDVGASLGLLIFLPSAFFTSLLVVSSCSFQRAPGVTWALALAQLCLALLFLVVKSLARNHSKHVNYSCNLYKFWTYQGQPVYEDVDPSANALSFLDAGELHFTQGSAVDVSRAFTHRGGDGTMLCLAPITGSGPSGGIVQFWAVGDPLYAGNMVDQFRKAALTFGGQSAPDALFVIWAAHPSEIAFGHWRHGVAFMLCACGLHLALSVFLGFAMHFGRRGGKPRLDLRPMGWGTGRALAASTSLPDLREVEAPFARKTFQRISSTLSRVPDLDEMGTKIVEIRDGIGGYFESHHRSLSCHEELLEQPVPSRVFGPLRLRTRQASSIIVCSCRDRAPHLGTSLPRTCARSWPGSLPSHLR
eukprot:s3622_g1.t2